MQMPSILQGESLKRLLQGATVGAVATIVVGFNWGGWSLGSTADKMAKDRSDLAVVAALAPVKLGDIEKETWRWKSNSSIYSSDCDVTDFGKFSGVARLGGAEEGDWLRGRSSGCRPYRAIRRYGRRSRLS